MTVLRYRSGLLGSLILLKIQDRRRSSNTHLHIQSKRIGQREDKSVLVELEEDWVDKGDAVHSVRSGKLYSQSAGVAQVNYEPHDVRMSLDIG